MTTIGEALEIAVQRCAAGRIQEAEQICRQILAVHSDFADAWHLLGVVALQTDRYEAAETYIAKAINLDSTKSSFYCNLGNVLKAQKRFDEAIGCFGRAIELEPSDPELHYNLGNTLRADERLEEAVACYRRALEIDPTYALAHDNLGSTLQHLGRLDEAIARYRCALEHKPDESRTHSNLGNALQRLRRFDEAAACYARALELDPRQPYAHFSSAALKLLTGDFSQGWAEYEWRWKLSELRERQFSEPQWNGEELGQRHIFLHAEQAFGDTIQFIRYAALVKERNPRATLTVELPRPLTKLLAKCPGIDQLVAEGDELPPFDIHLPLASLPGIFNTTLTTIPNRIPYLSADRVLRDEWRVKLGSFNGLRIGINWRGRALTRDRDLPVRFFADLASLPGVQLISLQKQSAHDELDDAKQRLPIVSLGPDFDRHHGAFMDTAAVMMNLDLVISSDTAIAHLAGALGVPVWLALPYVPEWRWLLDRSDSPWYPTMRLFRQKKVGDWEGVFEEVREGLRELVG
jgi:Flp pilus assembly protein TadD